MSEDNRKSTAAIYDSNLRLHILYLIDYFPSRTFPRPE